jgi:phosphoribosylamine--glycine ligase
VKVLLLGSGGRESALAAALARSSLTAELVVAPGNPGVAEVATTLELDPADPAAVAEAAAGLDSDLVVIGPEAPLVTGVADALRAQGRLVFGPDAAAARIEGSKSHAKELMRRAGIATARWKSFRDAPSAAAYLDELGPPYVVKADGLASGKGVVVTTDRSEAEDAVEAALLRGRFGAAGRTLVIEEFLDGAEVSVIAVTDGVTVLACEPAQDYKRAFDADRGPNTGGMGSYSPVPACPPELVEHVAAGVIAPMVRATAAGGAPFVGAIYAGLVLTEQGPKVLEFNARFGDPETQALLPRLRSDFGELCLACARRELRGARLEWADDACVCVVLASAGYPGTYCSGLPIEGVDEAAGVDGVEVFHAGTARRHGTLITGGGRVLAVSALGASLATARRRAYEAAARIDFDGKQLRSDIALAAAHAERARA